MDCCWRSGGKCCSVGCGVKNGDGFGYSLLAEALPEGFDIVVATETSG
jgi:hypothetical protein